MALEKAGLKQASTIKAIASVTFYEIIRRALFFGIEKLLASRWEK